VPITPRRVAVGRRFWDVLLVPHGTSVDDVRLAVAQHAPDVVLIDATSETASIWKDLVADAIGHAVDAMALSRQRLAAFDVSEFHDVLGIGRARFLAQFSEETEKEKRAPRAAPLDPQGFIPFPEANRLDPFALNETFRREAWGTAWTLIGRLLRQTHLHAVAVTWPNTTGWGYADPERKPWRNVASLAKSEAATVPPATREHELYDDRERGDALLAYNLRSSYEPDGGDEEGDATRGNELPLLLLQRMLLALHASPLSPASASDCWWTAAELLEELGYLTVTYAYSLGVPTSLKPYFDAASLLGHLHSRGVGYGDMHLGNCGYLPHSTQRAVLIDPGGSYELTDLNDPADRAADLAVFRLECDYLQWQAALLGYAAAQPRIAADVIALFPEGEIRP
jgi:hypothetical protein